MKKVTVRRYSNDNEPKVVATAANGTIVDQFVKFSELDSSIKVENMDMPDLLNVKPELVHVTNDKNGQNVKYTLSTYSYDEFKYEVDENDENITVNDKLKFLSEMSNDKSEPSLDDEWLIMNGMVFDWFDTPVKVNFKASAKVILNANSSMSADNIDLQSSSVNGFDAIHLYKGTKHLVVDAFYDGSFKATVFDDKELVDESKQTIDDDYVSTFIKLNF